MGTQRVIPLVLVGLSLVSVGPVHSAPEPADVPQSWELRFQYVTPQRIAVRFPGEAEPRTFWYLLYTVTNESGRAVQFFPTFELMTDTNKVYPSADGVRPAVYEAIRRRHAKTHPFLTEPVRMLGRLLDGQDNARDSVAIWSDFDPSASRFTIFVGGLSGETQQIPNPLYDPSRPEFEKQPMPDGSTLEAVVNPKHFTLRKTLVLEYDMPGTRVTRASARPQQRSRHNWTMR